MARTKRNPEIEMRKFVFETIATGDVADIDGKILAQNCDIITRWIMTGDLPQQQANLKIVQ